MRLSAIILAAAVVLQIAPAMAAQPAPAQKSGLTRLLEAELARFPGRAGIYIKHLATGEEAAVRGDEAFESASTIKMAALVRGYQLADQKKLDLNARYTIKPADQRGGSFFGNMDLGLNPTYRDVMTEMVITSDNAATDIMIATVGGKEALNAWLKQSGFNVLNQTHTTFEYFRQQYELIDPRYRELTPEDLLAMRAGSRLREAVLTPQRAALVKEIESRSAKLDLADMQAKHRADPKNWFGAASPREMGRLLEGIETGTIASKDACEEMKRMLRAQQSGGRKIAHWLTVPVGHKTGETTGVTNDVGMIYARSGTIVIAFYNQGYTGLRSEADVRLGHVARLVVEYFDGQG